MQEDFLNNLVQASVKDISYNDLTAEDLLSETLYDSILSIGDELKINQAMGLCGNRARKLNMKSDFDKCYKSYINQLARIELAEGNAGSVTDFSEQPLVLRCGQWIADDTGVRKCKRTPDGGSTWDVASPIPIMPTEIYENIDSGIEKIRLSFYKNGSWKSLVCNRVTAASSMKIIELADMGIEVTSESSKHLVKYISDMVALNTGTIPRYKSISHLGWAGKEFIPYNSVYKFDGEDAAKQLYESVTQKGDYATWLACVKQLRKNTIFRIALATSYASPLVKLAGALPFITHLWGTTESGKTVAQMVAASVWGNPEPGKLLRSLNMTEYSMLSMSVFLGGICFVADELQSIKNKWTDFDRLIMMLCEGQDKGRMSYSKALPIGNWSCSYLFSGEEPITYDTSGGGVKNRVIEVQCNEVIIPDGHGTVELIKENYGHAGKDFMDLLKNHNISEMYSKIQKQILAESETTSKQAMALALILLADQLISKYIFDDKPLEIYEISYHLKSKSEVDTSERSYQYIMNHIANNASRFNPDTLGELWGIIRESEILLNKNILQRELKSVGFEFDAVKAKWAESGYIIKNSQGYYTHQTRVHGIKADFIKFTVC